MSYAPIRAASILNPTETPEPSPAESRKNLLGRTHIRLEKKNGYRAARNDDKISFPIIVHCHLCWDWVWQRPQQFLSRLSRRHKILFVETVGPDPELAMPLVRYNTVGEFPNITRLRLQFPSWQWTQPELVDLERRRIVRELMQGLFAGQFDNPVQWFYDPMAATAFCGHMGEIATVYDCMDELSKFRFAPPEIHEREAELLACADVVFAGGRKLWESKSRFHHNCHFYGCGVDGEHFGQARLLQTVVPVELASLPKPVLGYFGVIDERIDYDLLSYQAEAHPEWTIVMVGPVFKVEESALPRRKNIHWLGKKDYAELPALCKGFDVCLMPFALNEATEFINPTKTLEYMATGRPIVSTAVPDVVANFRPVVKIASSPAEFDALCARCLQAPDPGAIERGLQMARENSWDSIVEKLENHLQHAVRHNSKCPVAA